MMIDPEEIRLLSEHWKAQAEACDRLADSRGRTEASIRDRRIAEVFRGCAAELDKLLGAKVA